jgi:alpha-amylase/alpha-mannosidase (GH57 family)
MEPPMPHYKTLLPLLMLLVVCHAAPAGDLYLNLIWHQHQPLYVDPQTDQLRGPWVRTHATKDYYDMAAMHEDFPDVHATINLTSSLLYQLQHYYVERLSPFLYTHADGKRAIREQDFLKAWDGKTDPWIDLALKPTQGFTDADKATLVSNSWNAFGISDVQIARFPQYLALRQKPREQLTRQDYRAIKCWFFLAHFDPDFLRGTSKLDVDLSDLVKERDGTFYLLRPFTERDANRLVADAVRVMQAIVPEHAALSAGNHKQQLELITTPYYHPILPLLIDSDIARVCQPKDSLPGRFAYPSDAMAQVKKGAYYFNMTFGYPLAGMWPAEGSISAAAADVFAQNGVRWICGDMRVLAKSMPANLDIAKPCRFRTPHGDVMIVFRETNLSDHIGFTYQRMQPDSAVKHFVAEVMKYKPQASEADRLLTVILDGENAWEWYENDMDGKRFLRGLYAAFSAARTQKDFTCVTPLEFLNGDPQRGVPAHPLESMQTIETLWPGSWINANYDTWIGEPEENKAWEYLRQTRMDLERSGLVQPDPIQTGLPEMSHPNWTAEDDRKWAPTLAAYESMYAAEGSDWFWWYGADQTAPGGDLPFEQAFFSHLRAVYQHMREAGVKIETPDFAPILSAAKRQQQSGGGVMAQGAHKVKVKFVCDASAVAVPKAIYITGNLPEIGPWQPNVVPLFDDGTHGDAVAGDKRWTLDVEIAAGTEVQYKYTNSGAPGVWVPSEEFSSTNRAFTVTESEKGFILRADVFGKYE